VALGAFDDRLARSFDASSTPANAVIRPDVTKAPITNFRVGMPFNSAARWFAPMA
jgi:hypothetical protein